LLAGLRCPSSDPLAVARENIGIKKGEGGQRGKRERRERREREAEVRTNRSCQKSARISPNPYLDLRFGADLP